MRQSLESEAGHNVLFANELRTADSFTPDEIVSILDRADDSGASIRNATHHHMQRLWLLCMCFYIGNQGLAPLRAIGDIDPNFFPVESGYKANYIQQIVLHAVSRLSSADPTFDFTPKSPDPDDTFAAKVAEAFLSHWGEVLGFALQRQEQAFWNAICGTSFLMDDWDASAGQKIETFTNPFDGSVRSVDSMPESMREFARKAESVQSRHEGNLTCEVLSPFQVTMPRGFRKLETMPWVIIHRERSLDWVWDRYPEQAKQLGVDSFDRPADQTLWKKLANLVTNEGMSLGSGGTEPSEVVTVRELWVPPSGRFPDGLWACGLRNVYLSHGPHPWAAAKIDHRTMPWMRFPISISKFAEVPGRLWGMGIIEHLLHPQLDYNRGRTQEIQIRDRLAIPIWLKNSKTKLSSTRMEVGDIMEWEGNHRPELQPPPPMSAGVEAGKMAAAQDMRSIASMHEATQGDAPGNVRSGIAVRYLQERDTASSIPAVKSMEASWSERAMRISTLTWKFLDIPRAIGIYGEARQADVAIYKGSMIGGNVHLRVRPNSMMPKSKAEMSELLMNLLQIGGLNPADPEQLEILLNGIEIGGADKLFFERRLDKRRAEVENHMFQRPEVDPLTGRPQPFPDVRDDDDHQVHLRQHMLLLKSDAFEVLPTMRKMAFEAHLQKHKMAIAEAMMAMQAMAGGGESGGGSPPKPPGEASQPAQKNKTPGSE